MHCESCHRKLPAISSRSEFGQFDLAQTIEEVRDAAISDIDLTHARSVVAATALRNTSTWDQAVTATHDLVDMLDIRPRVVTSPDLTEPD